MTDGIASPVVFEFWDVLLTDFFPTDFYPFFLGDLLGDLFFLAFFSSCTFGVSKSISSMASCFPFLPGESRASAPVSAIY